MKSYKNRIKDEVINLSHGDGGIKTGELINSLILKYLKNDILDRLEDSAVIHCLDKKMAFTTDSFVVSPIFFPGGDIGKLSICGTINDLVTSGCKPFALSFSLIIEEGFAIKDLEKILASVKKTLDEINKDLGNEIKVMIITGDTKVVEKGNADKIYINTSGIGFLESNTSVSPKNIKSGDLILINGSIGDHGISILAKRKEFDFKISIKSDCSPLSSLIKIMFETSSNIHALRDATRGGLARVLIEMAQSSNNDFDIFMDKIPIKQEVRGICEFLGMDPMYIANEGKMVVFVSADDAKKVIDAMKKNKYGKESAIIGTVSKKGNGRVLINTEIGTRRILDLQYSEQLPRIC
ncbi:MAG: hydrogenase expression/formation protein HypE [Actinobacteria bacterium]|nr:hydrogenase expression/formation protein HypE [Actinomycetota bacterium]